jgi:hypothetical protein
MSATASTFGVERRLAITCAALSTCRRPKSKFSSVTPVYPGWTDMLRQGATTFWESWENNQDLSHLHSSFLYLRTWFIEGVGGIKPDPA